MRGLLRACLPALLVAAGSLLLAACSGWLAAGQSVPVSGLGHSIQASAFDFAAAFKGFKLGGPRAVLRPTPDATGALAVGQPFSFAGGTLALDPGIRSAWIRPSGSDLLVNADGRWYRAAGALATVATPDGVASLSVLPAAARDYPAEMLADGMLIDPTLLDNRLAFEPDPAGRYRVSIFAGPGDDLVVIFDASGSVASGSLIRGGDGDDVLASEAAGSALFGEAGADWLYGSAGADELDGGSGDDRIDGRGGDDLVRGGPGANFIAGR